MRLDDIALLRTGIIRKAIFCHVGKALLDVCFVIYCGIFMVNQSSGGRVMGFFSFLVVLLDGVIKSLPIL